MDNVLLYDNHYHPRTDSDHAKVWPGLLGSKVNYVYVLKPMVI